jgi:hypothetical protein
MHPAHTKRKPKGTQAMQIELRTGAVQLGPNQTLKVLDGAGSTLCALEGALWITEENQVQDIILEAGNCYRLRHPGTTLVNSLGGVAAVSLN